MKTAKEIKVENRTHTQLTCTSCGAVTHVKAGIGTKTAKDALDRRCGPVSRNHLAGCGWWTALASIPTVASMDLCRACGLGVGTEWRKHVAVDGWRGPGLMSTPISGKSVKIPKK